MIPTAVFVLWCVAGLLAIAVLAVAGGRREFSTGMVYLGTAGASAAMLTAALGHLFGDPPALSSVSLPLGLPWIGAHFRVDALAAFFLVVVNLGGFAASLYGLGHGGHESAPHRVLPFFPAFLAGMNLVLVADDAFTFLLSWEFMSLASWALVMSHHRERDNARAGYVYIVMASFGTMALLLAFGLLAGPDGSYAFDAIRERSHGAFVVALVLSLTLLGAGLEGRSRPAARLAAARPPGGAEPRLGADERRHDQSRRLRLHSHRLRPLRKRSMVGEPGRAGAPRASAVLGICTL